MSGKIVPKIGINLASLFPFTMLGVDFAGNMIQRAGFVGVQVLPMRVISANFERDAVISLEKEWNAGSLYGAILRHLRLAGGEYPLIWDWLMFGTKRQALTKYKMLRQQYPNAVYVAHSRDEKNPVETSPEALMTQRDYMQYVPGVVVDCAHIRRVGRNGEPIVAGGDWLEFTERLVRTRQVKLVHFHPVGEESTEVLAGKMPDHLGEFLKIVRNAGVPVVLEIRPPVRLPGRTVQVLSSVRELMVRCLSL